jgi:menaquinol-cytochrome c reductase iron-sulfur subunit
MMPNETQLMGLPRLGSEPTRLKGGEAQRHEQKPGRRSFLGLLGLLGGAAVAAAFSVPLIRYIAYPLGAEAAETEWTDLGPLEDFATPGEPVKKLVSLERLDGWQKTEAQQAVYVTHGADGSLAVLSAVCPHLGCSVAWKAESEKFVCQCHGGCFAATGERLSGPPPRGLHELAVKTGRGRLLVNCQASSKAGTPA